MLPSPILLKLLPNNVGRETGWGYNPYVGQPLVNRNQVDGHIGLRLDRAYNADAIWGIASDLLAPSLRRMLSGGWIDTKSGQIHRYRLEDS